MTLPIIPFAPLAEAALTLGTAETTGPSQGPQFSEVLGTALGATAGSTAAQTPSLSSLIAMLMGGKTLNTKLGESSGTLSSDELDALARALGTVENRTTPDAAVGELTRRTSNPTFPTSQHGLPELRQQVSSDVLKTLREMVQDQYPNLLDRLRDGLIAVPSKDQKVVEPSEETVQEPQLTVAPFVVMPLPAIGEALRTTGVSTGLVRGTAPNANPLEVSRDVNALVPDLRARLETLVDRMQNEFGYSVEVVETVRSQARQDVLFAQGRTTPGPVVTWTRSSPHLDGRAVDVKIDGGYDNLPAFQTLGRVARELGLRTLWPRDPGHVELPLNSSAPLARIPEAAGTRVGIQKPIPVEVPMIAVPTRAIDVPAPVPARIPENMAAERGDQRAAAQLPAAPTQSTQNPGRVAQVAQVATVAAVAQVATMASVARVASVAQVAHVQTTMSTAESSAPDTSARRLVQSTTRARTAESAGAVVSSEAQAPAPMPAATVNVLDRVMAAVNAHLEHGARNGGRESDERGAERDLVAAVRERMEASGSMPQGRATDFAHVKDGSGIVGTDGLVATNMAERIANVLDARDAAAERPLSSVLLRLDHPEGGEDRIRIELRGQSVSTTLDVRDPIAADRLSAHAPELARALSQHGLDPENVTIRAIRPDASLAGVSGAVSERDAVRSSQSSSASTGDHSHSGRDSRDPSRFHDHQNGDSKQRNRRDSRGSR